MDFVEISLLREVTLSSTGHPQHQLPYHENPLLSSPLEEEAVVDHGSLRWGDFSVDELLDLGGGTKQNCGGGESFLGFEAAAEEEGDDGQLDVCPNDSNTSSSSALSVQAPLLPCDPIVPAGDMAELEWVSRFVDDSYSELPTSSISPPFQRHHAPAPAPALPAAAAKCGDPTSGCSSSRCSLKRNWGSLCFFIDTVVVPAKARSKRPRSGGRVWPLCWPPLLPMPWRSAASSALSPPASGRWPAATLQPPPPPPPHQLRVNKKMKGRKPKTSAVFGSAAGGAAGGEQLPGRRCSHCGTVRTPQWRAGPMGAKTLCNACGVRYKSGRLLPEYRPAGSPTFLSLLHSNSHRKILEMRREKLLLAAPAASASASGATSAKPHGVV